MLYTYGRRETERERERESNRDPGGEKLENAALCKDVNSVAGLGVYNEHSMNVVLTQSPYSTQ